VILKTPFAIDRSRSQVHLRLLGTTDLHVHLMPYDYYADRPAPHIGLAMTARLIRDVRAVSQNCLLLDNGDFLQGTPLSDLIAEGGMDLVNGVHPVMSAMNSLGYDAATLGNHEFNYGLDFLRDVLEQAQFPVISANVLARPGTAPLVPPFVILDKMVETSDGGVVNLRIGVIGFAPPQIAQWDRQALNDGVVTRDIVESAKAQIPIMQAAGVDVIVALSHSGIGAETHVPGMENAAVPLAGVPGIDAVFAGHTHMVFPGPQVQQTDHIDANSGLIHGKPVVMAGFNGSHLGVIDLLLDREAERWKVVTQAVSVLRVACTQARDDPSQAQGDSAIVAAALPAHRATLSYIRRPVGRTRVPLQSYFSFTAPDRTLAIVAGAQRDFAQNILSGTEYAALPLLSAVAPFRTGGRSGPDNYIDIPAGPLSLRNVSELYQFPNMPCALILFGWQVADWLEQAAGVFARIVPGQQDQPLIDPHFPSYNFDVLDGLTYVIDPSQPRRFWPDGAMSDSGAKRIRNLRYNGEPVAAESRFVVVTNSYRAGGGGGYGMLARVPVIASGRVSTRDLIIRHIRAEGSIAPQAKAIWTFASLPGTRAVFESGKGAVAHLNGLCGLNIREDGPGAEGFHRFVLDF
jgi:2',3'-cyclic-nucleotide 2'-phosphodiesterase/3'-nucleotidase